MKEWMNKGNNKLKNKRTKGWINKSKDEQKNEWMNLEYRCTLKGWINKSKDEQMNEWMNLEYRCTLSCDCVPNTHRSLIITLKYS